MIKELRKRREGGDTAAANLSRASIDAYMRGKTGKSAERNGTPRITADERSIP